MVAAHRSGHSARYTILQTGAFSSPSVLQLRGGSELPGAQYGTSLPLLAEEGTQSDVQLPAFYNLQRNCTWPPGMRIAGNTTLNL